MSLDQLPVNAFDVSLVAILMAGVLRGRKRGMSEELMSLVKWLLVVFVCAVAYQPLGTMLAQSTPFSELASYLMVYTGIALLIVGIFALIKHSTGDKLVGSDVFGKSEYYLGMCSGFVRYGCILMAALALLNARYFSSEEVRARQHYQNDVYGSDYFPGLHTAQATVFENSLTGPWIRDHLGFLLIKPTQPEDTRYRQKEFTLPY